MSPAKIVAAIIVLVISLASVPAWASTRYLANASTTPVGSDANSGVDAAHPWLTPNHALNCGDVILAAASTAYSYANFMAGKWGAVTCPANNNVAWLKCATFDACKIAVTSGTGAAGMMIDASYWGVQGWEVTTSGGTFQTGIAILPTGSANIHHIIVANNIINGAEAGGIASSNRGSASSDYVVIIGNIAWGTSTGNELCYSGLSVYQPLATDSLPGTHIYMAGNFSWNNVDPGTCNGTPSTDGEGIILDSVNDGQGGLAPVYNQQIAVENNLVVWNGGVGIWANSGSGNTSARTYISHNTVYGNLYAVNGNSWCGEISTDSSGYTQVYSNLVQTGAATGCYLTTTPLYVFEVSRSTATNIYHDNFGYSAAGHNTDIQSSNGFTTYGPGNTFGTNPAFVNTAQPGAPSCGSASSVTNCMAAVIANFTPTNTTAMSYGYQVPSTTPVTNPLYPQWLCSVTNLPTGLVTPGCAVPPPAKNLLFGGGMKIGSGITITQAQPLAAVVVFTASGTSNANSSQGTAPSRKQLGNFGTGCVGAVVQPTGVPVGQIYSTAAVRTAAIAAGCPTQAAVTTTTSGTGIAAPDNGFNAGGFDSSTAITSTYGTTAYDSYCASDPYSAPALILGVTTPGCVSSSSAVFSQTTAVGHGDSGMLWPTGWNSTATDSADHWLSQFYFSLDNLANDWNVERDTNYTASDGSYFGWGLHWNRAIAMWQYCPQNCTAWVTLRFTNVATGAVVTAYPFAANDVIAMQIFVSHDPGCTYASLSKCYWYDYVRIWNVTTGTAPVLYSLLDHVSGTRAGGIPVNHTSWTKPFPHTQWQIDKVSASAGTSSTLHVNSDVFMGYHF